MISTPVSKAGHGSADRPNAALTGPDYESLMINLERRHDEALAMLADLEARIGQALRAWASSGRRSEEGRGSPGEADHTAFRA